MHTVELSIIIVAYKAQKELEACLTSIYRNKPNVNFEVIIVDNNELRQKYNFLSKFKNVKYFKTSSNLGYGAGVNYGLIHSIGDYIMILNSDISISENAINILIDKLSVKKIGIVAPKLLDMNSNEYSLTGSSKLTPLSAIFALSIINKILPYNPISNNYYLRGKDRKSPYSLDVVPGSAMMIKRDVFEQVGGFDEKFFLYFEESDLCKRVREAGYEIRILPEAKVYHGWEKSTTKGEKTDRIFRESRMHYFRKHYGIFWMVVVEAFTRFSKYTAILLFITLVGAILRFSDFSYHIAFHGELGHNYLAARDFFESGKFPLIGPPTSHPWLSFSPLFYWIIIPVLLFSQWSPIGPAFFMTTLHCLLPLISYLSLRNTFNKKVALITAGLLSISPFMVTLSREARFFSLSMFPIFPFIYFLLKKRFVTSSFLLSLSLSFHYTPLTLVPAFIYLFIKSKPSRQITYKVLVAALIPHIPYLIHLVIFDPSTLVKIVSWIPYRFARFGGLIEKDAVVDPGVNFFQLVSLLFSRFASSMIGIALSLSLFVTKRNRFLLLFITTALIGLFVHGNPPVHYFIPIVPFIFSYAAYVLQSRNTFVVITIFVLIFLLNSSFFFGKDDRFERGLVPFSVQSTIMREITQNTNGQPYQLKRVGPNDQFEGTYAQNYWYLGWLYGNRPTTDAQKVVTIYENGEHISYEIK
jgi:GT2 family glycosyltransferase